MSEQNPFEELDDLPLDNTREQEALDKIQRDVEGSYSVSRDLFQAVSTITDKLFTVFSGFIGFFEGEEERFLKSNNLGNTEKEKDGDDSK